MNITKGKTAKAQKVVLYGPEGIGKSSFAAQFPDPIFIDTEGSTGNMDVARMDKPNSWTMLHQQVDFIKNNQPCKTLIIDTIDWAERLAIDFVVSRANKKSITGFGYGEGFIQLEEEFGKFLNKLSDLVEMGINVVLTAHAKITKFEQPDEMGAYDRWELKLGNKTTAKTASLAKEWADMVLFMNYKTFSVATDDKGNKHKGQGGERTIYANHHPAWDAKNRHDLPDEFKMDYGQIAHIFAVSGQAAPNPTQLSNMQAASNQQIQQEPSIQAPPEKTIQPEPVQEQQSASQPETNTTNPFTGQINPNLPKALQDLMTQNHVSEQEIQTVVGAKGYYPADTPITNYDESFINGVLVGAWDQVFGMVQQQRQANAPF